MIEAHLFTQQGSPALKRFLELAPYASAKTDCDPANNPGGLCFNCPSERLDDFERAARKAGVAMQWGGGATNNYVAVEAVGDYLYIADLDGAALIIRRLRNPASLTLVTTFSLPFSPRALRYYDGLIFMPASSGRIMVVNVDDPASPTVESTSEPAGFTWNSIEIFGSTIFLLGPSAANIGVYLMGDEGNAPERLDLEPAANGTEQAAVSGRRMWYADAFAADCKLYSARMGGTYCPFATFGSLRADAIQAQLVAGRHLHLTGDIVARSLTVFGASFETRGGVANVFNFIRLGDVLLAWGSGDPEGTFPAPQGSTYNRTGGGAATSFYVKEAGSDEFGWVAK